MEEFLLAHYKAKRLFDIDPWAPYRANGIESWEPAREVTVSVDFEGPGEVLVDPKVSKQPRTLFRGLPASLDLISVTQLFVRNIESGPKADYYVQTNFVPVSCQKAQAEQDRLHEAAGILPRTIMRIPPSTNVDVHVRVHSSAPGDCILNQGFIRTCAFLGDTNLLNGIVRIPDSIRESLPKEAEVYDRGGNKEYFPVEHYYLVPADHVVAWKLNVEDEWRRRKGLFALEVSVTDRDNPTVVKLLFYVVADRTLYGLISWVRTNWLGQVDLRPLDTVGFNFVGFNQDSQGPVKMRATLSYMCWPTMTPDQISSLLPVVHKNMLPYSEVLMREIRQMNP